MIRANSNGGMMEEYNLTTLIQDKCEETGKMQGIEFHPLATRGLQVPGRWEAGYFLRRQGLVTVVLSYWFTMNLQLREEIKLPWAFPPTSEQAEKLKAEISSVIARMLKWPVAPSFLPG